MLCSEHATPQQLLDRTAEKQGTGTVPGNMHNPVTYRYSVTILTFAALMPLAEQQGNAPVAPPRLPDSPTAAYCLNHRMKEVHVVSWSNLLRRPHCLKNSQKSRLRGMQMSRDSLSSDCRASSPGWLPKWALPHPRHTPYFMESKKACAAIDPRMMQCCSFTACKHSLLSPMRSALFSVKSNVTHMQNLH